MAQKSLDVFSLRDTVVGEYKKFATSFTTIFAEDIRTQIDAIYAQDRYWPEPLIQVSPSYKRTTTVEALARNGVLHPKAADIFRSPAASDGAKGKTLSLYKHQEQAIALASQGESYVVTTGTGSGKSLCFFIPILNSVLSERARGGAPRTRAIIVYVPATNDGRGRQAYLQRPRFLALSEFGPRSLVYHEGRAYRVVRALLALEQSGGAAPDARLPTKSVRICKRCGGGHFDDHASMCRACGMSLGDAEIVNDMYRIENVATQPAERITANDEERQRQGFELQTTFEWAVRDHGLDVRRGQSVDGEGEIARLAYGPGATITRLNKGLRRRANRTRFGFMIDPVSGYWAKNEEDGADEPEDPTASPRQWIVPSVQDRKNALLLQPTGQEYSQTTLATVQHALLRGLEAVFQLEEGEILAEPMPIRDERSGVLFYEATEGGAGVLTRLVAEPDRIAEVARKALAIMHFAIAEEEALPKTADELGEISGTACVAACYRCLMSYFNQPDHELLDRRDLDGRTLLLRLARSTTSGLTLAAVPRPAATSDSSALETARPLDRWMGQLRERGLPAPDPEPLTPSEALLLLVWRAHYTVAILGNADPATLQALASKGFEVVVFEELETGWPAAFGRLASALGFES